MERHGFVMRLFPGKEAEYKSRHDAIWPALEDLLKNHGISDYTIFLQPSSGLLFATYQVKDTAKLAHLKDTPIMRKWWHYMKDLMETYPDESPISDPLQQVFYMR